MTKERREELLRSTTRQRDDMPVTADDGAQFWDMDHLTSGELRDLLSQERICSTCQHMFISAGLVDVDEQVPTCMHPESPVRDYGDVSIEHFGCSLWEKADPETKGDTK